MNLKHKKFPFLIFKSIEHTIYSYIHKNRKSPTPRTLEIYEAKIQILQKQVDSLQQKVIDLETSLKMLSLKACF